MTFSRLKPSAALVVAMASMAAPFSGPANAAELTSHAVLSDTRPGQYQHHS